jgi:hypothetical protein
MTQWVWPYLEGSSETWGWIRIANFPSMTLVGPRDTWFFSSTNTEAPPTIDGVLGEGEWAEARARVVNKTAIDARGIALAVNPEFLHDDADLTMTVHSMWDDTNWYLGIDVIDDEVLYRRSPGEPQNGSDSVGLFCDILNDDVGNTAADIGHAALYFAPGSVDNGADEPIFAPQTDLGMGAGRFENVEWFITNNDNGYVIEAAIPWTDWEDFQPKVTAGQVIGVNFACHDWDNEAKAEEICVLSQNDPDTIVGSIDMPSMPMLVGVAAPDGDSDMLPDEDEWRYYNTDMNGGDTDGDTFIDGWEVTQATDPTDVDSYPDTHAPLQEELPAAGGVALTGLAAILAALARCRSRR